jgi:hypothetical protein
MYPGVGYHVARALTDFSDAEVEPDPIVLDGAAWKEAKGSAARLAADLAAHLAVLAKAGSMR